MRLPAENPSVIVVDFLRKTEMSYAIIGGKAAAYHIQDSDSAAPATLALAMSTNDYDVMVNETISKVFIEQLQTELRHRTHVTLDEKRFESPLIDIVMMGIHKKGMFDSIVDVHIVKTTKDTHFPKVVKDRTGLRYATKDWVCKELKYSMKYHASADEVTKALKRKARHELLKCE